MWFDDCSRRDRRNSGPWAAVPTWNAVQWCEPKECNGTEQGSRIPGSPGYARNIRSGSTELLVGSHNRVHDAGALAFPYRFIESGGLAAETRAGACAPAGGRKSPDFWALWHATVAAKTAESATENIAL